MLSSPIHDGIKGTDSGEVWISTFEDAIVMMPPYLEVLLSFLLRKHFFLFLASSSLISVRYSWAFAHFIQACFLARLQSFLGVTKCPHGICYALIFLFRLMAALSHRSLEGSLRVRFWLLLPAFVDDLDEVVHSSKDIFH